MPKNIVIDLNKITKREMLEWQHGRRGIISDDNSFPMDLEKFDFERLYQIVIAAWPHGEINLETFLDLPYPESVAVDNAVNDAVIHLSKKK